MASPPDPTARPVEPPISDPPPQRSALRRLFSGLHFRLFLWVLASVLFVLMLALYASLKQREMIWQWTNTFKGVAFSCVLVLVIGGLLIDRFILRYVRALIAASRRLAAGELGARASVPHGTAEMDELAHVFNEMASAIEQRILERERMQRDIHRLASFPELYPNPLIEADRGGEGLVTYRNPVARAQYPELSTLGFDHPVLQGVIEEAAAHQRQGRHFFLREVKLGSRICEEQIFLIPDTTLLHVYVADVTERKHAERELHLAYQRLKDTRAQLIQADRLASVGQLSAGIAHELKNPLAIILQGVEFLEANPQPDTAQWAEVVAMTKKAVVRADAIIRNLLTFTRQTPPQRQSVNLHDTITSSLMLVKKQVTASGATIVQAFEAAPALVLADPNQMEQIFINLIINALQAMPQGGRLTLKTYRQVLATLGNGVGRRAEDFFTAGQEAILCEVTDTGLGITEENLDRVFDPFFTTKPPGEGTGLGLPTVQSIVDAHRGLINIESQVGRGTTVRITLPPAQSRPMAGGLTEDRR